MEASVHSDRPVVAPRREAAVLVVDDDEHVRRALKRVLKRARCRLYEAPDAQAAFRIESFE